MSKAPNSSSLDDYFSADKSDEEAYALLVCSSAPKPLASHENDEMSLSFGRENRCQSSTKEQKRNEEKLAFPAALSSTSPEIWRQDGNDISPDLPGSVTPSCEIDISEFSSSSSSSSLTTVVVEECPATNGCSLNKEQRLRSSPNVWESTTNVLHRSSSCQDESGPITETNQYQIVHKHTTTRLNIASDRQSIIDDGCPSLSSCPKSGGFRSLPTTPSADFVIRTDMCVPDVETPDYESNNKNDVLPDVGFSRRKNNDDDTGRGGDKNDDDTGRGRNHQRRDGRTFKAVKLSEGHNNNNKGRISETKSSGVMEIKSIDGASEMSLEVVQIAEPLKYEKPRLSKKTDNLVPPYSPSSVMRVPDNTTTTTTRVLDNRSCRKTSVKSASKRGRHGSSPGHQFPPRRTPESLVSPRKTPESRYSSVLTPDSRLSSRMTQDSLLSRGTTPSESEYLGSVTPEIQFSDRTFLDYGFVDVEERLRSRAEDRDSPNSDIEAQLRNRIIRTESPYFGGRNSKRKCGQVEDSDVWRFPIDRILRLRVEE